MTLRIQQLFSLILLTGMLFLFTNSHAQAATETPFRFKKLVILGDSLSDPGNLYNGNTAWWLPIPAHFIPKAPYYEGRFSNGPVWADFFTDMFTAKGITTLNYAVGGSLINRHFGIYLPYTLGNAIDHYFSIENPQPAEIAESTYLIWIGANDYLQGLQYFSDAETDTSYAIDTLRMNMLQLIQAHANKFILMNLPDISKAPYETDPDKRASMHQLITLHNQKLLRLIQELKEQNPNIDIQFYDTETMFEQLLTDPEGFNKKYHTALNISEKQKPCWTGGYRKNTENLQRTEEKIQQQLDAFISAQNAVNTLYASQSRALAHDIATSPSLFEAWQVSNEGGLACEHPEQYIFWDRVHPTTAVHQAMSTIIFNSVVDYWVLEAAQ